MTREIIQINSNGVRMQSQVTFYKRGGGKFDKTRRDKATKTRKAEKRAIKQSLKLPTKEFVF